MTVTFEDPGQASDQQRGDHLFAQIFFTAEGTANPLPHYQAFLEEAPVHVSGFGGALLSRYADCRALLRNNAFGNGDGMPDGSFGGADSPELALRRARQQRRQDEGSMSMLGLDPPDHTRQRSLVSRAFTPRVVEHLRPRVAELVEACLDELEDAATGGVADVMAHLARPLPVAVISELLGVPGSDWPSIRQEVTDLVAVLEPAAPLAQLERAEAASDVLTDYFRELLAERRRRPAEDLLTGLLTAADGDDRLTENEIVAVSVLLFAAGSETTTNLIGNAVHQLIEHPGQMERLWTDPDLVAPTIEEVLRFDSPVQLDGRMCLDATTFAGLRFEPGDRVITLLGAANHDPEIFENPGTFDITRYRPGTEPAAEPVMSFGSGIHYCLGANLARVEGQEALAGVVRRFGGLADAGGRVRRQALVLRGFDACPVRMLSR